ncbi:MAG: choice-of-anchor D domain-containing protein, partial [Solirubrobacterales bacterium]
QAQTVTSTPGIRRRSSTTLAVALVIPENTPAGKYSLTACLGGKVFRGASRCRTARNKVTILAPKVNLAISPTSHAFGDVAVGTDSPQQAFTITNQSLGPTAQPTVTLSGVGFLLASNGCTTPIPAGSACSVAVLFHPTAAGSQSGSVKVSTSGGSVTATLTGNGV